MPTVEPGHTFASVTDHISSIVLRKQTPTGWCIGFGSSAVIGVMVLTATIGKLLLVGVGIWGINHPVGWGFDILNFVWWIGIGHAGTLISAILLLLRQEWRTSINRFAEAMTLFAVAAAGLYPALHTGRPWYDYWLFPYPNTMTLWPQFRSPLMWDVFAVSTYATVSALFWYVGLIPDLATLRDRATQHRRRRCIYGMLALGWRGSAKHWHRYEHAYLLLAGLSTPLVLSVHTIVSFDFAVAQHPGLARHVLPAVLRRRRRLRRLRDGADAGHPRAEVLQARRLHHHEAPREHGQGHAGHGPDRLLLATSMEAFFACYSGNVFERYMWLNRVHGPYWKMYVALIVCNGLAPQLMWFKRFRTVARLALHHGDVRQRRHVAGALRHHPDLAAPRLPAVVVGHVPRHASGTGACTSARSACSSSCCSSSSASCR